MKLVVKKHVNVRTQQPLVLPDNNPGGKYLVPGDVVEVARTVQGQDYKGNDQWHELTNGTFVWSGAITPEATPGTANDINFWVKFFGLDTPLADCGKPVAALDTGIDEGNEDLKGVVAGSTEVIWGNRTAFDTNGHGTFCAGVIAGSGARRIIGGARGVKLMVAKIMTSPGLGGLTVQRMIDGLTWARKEADVISMSCGMPDDDPTLHSVIQGIVNEDNIPIIAAIGNNYDGMTTTGSYPALYPECISVGALTNTFDLANITVRNPKIDICVPGERIISTVTTLKGSYDEKTGTSMSTPLVAAIVKRLKLKYPLESVAQLKIRLSKYCDRKTVSGFTYPAIQPNKILI